MLDIFKEEFNKKGEVYLRIKAKPSASKTELMEILSDNTIKISIAASPEKGKANQELVKFLVREFSLEKENIKIISGAGDRIKLIKITK